jgi:hypothetical protein
MNKTLRRRLEMAARVREFLRAHPTERAGEEPALVRLEQLLERAQTLAGQQHAGLTAARSATIQREGIRRVIANKLLRFLMAAGTVASRDNLELAGQFQLPTSASHQSFLTAAQHMLKTATQQKDLLVREGMTASVIDDLTTALQQFEQTLEVSRVARRQHVEARSELEAVAAEIGDRVRLLDGLVRYRFGDDRELMDSWASARNVLGPFRPRSQPAGNETQPPATQGPDAARPAA